MSTKTHYEFSIPNAIGAQVIKKVPLQGAYISPDGSAIVFLVDRKKGREFIDYMHAFLDAVCLPEVAASEYKQNLVEQMLEAQKQQEAHEFMTKQLAEAAKKEAAPPTLRPPTHVERLQELASRAREDDAAGTLGVPPPDPFENAKPPVGPSVEGEPDGPVPMRDLFSALKEATEKAGG